MPQPSTAKIHQTEPFTPAQLHTCGLDADSYPHLSPDEQMDMVRTALRNTSSAANQTILKQLLLEALELATQEETKARTEGRSWRESGYSISDDPANESPIDASIRHCEIRLSLQAYQLSNFLSEWLRENPGATIEKQTMHRAVATEFAQLGSEKIADITTSAVRFAMALRYRTAFEAMVPTEQNEFFSNVNSNPKKLENSLLYITLLKTRATNTHPENPSHEVARTLYQKTKGKAAEELWAGWGMVCALDRGEDGALLAETAIKRGQEERKAQAEEHKHKRSRTWKWIGNGVMGAATVGCMYTIASWLSNGDGTKNTEATPSKSNKPIPKIQPMLPGPPSAVSEEELKRYDRIYYGETRRSEWTTAIDTQRTTAPDSARSK